MARKVKCRYCGKSIDRDKAYLVKKGKSNVFYCNEEHSKAKHPRDELYEQLNIIFGKTITHTTLYKEFDSLGKIYGYEKMLAYIKQEYSYLCMIMCKDFVSDFARIRYLAAVFKNNLGDFEMPKEEIKKEVQVDFEMFESKTVTRKSQKKGMDELLNDLLGDD